MKCINCPRDAGDRMLCQSCRASGEAQRLPLDAWLQAWGDATAVKLCHEFKELETPWGPIKLEQNGRNDFRVTYGKQVDDGLTYSQAARKLGEAQMHYLACLGKLDNRLSWGED